jgi:tetratricopeptide (TPR) repeat protein
MQLIFKRYKIKKGALFILLAAFSFSAIGQDDYKTAEATTLNMYNAKQWKELAKYGKENNLDYYNFNLRIGIAHYALNQFYEAEDYFLKALANNQTDFAGKYLFWTYLQMGERNIAENVYRNLSDNMKSQLGFKNTFVQGIYLEAGVKFPDEKSEGKLFYGSLVLHHNLAKNLRLTQSFTPFKQLATSHENISNYQYNSFVNYQWKNTNIGIGGMFAITNLDASYIYPTYRERQEIVTHTNSIYLNVNHRIKRLKLNLNINYTPQSIDYKFAYVPDSGNGNPPGEPTYYDSTATRSAFIPSVGIVYFPKFLKDMIAIGADVFMVSTNNETKFVIKPLLSIIISDKIWINTSYLQIDHQLFADYSTNIFYNISQETKRFSSTVSYVISPEYIINATYLNEAIHDNLTDNSFNLNSVFIGLKINI